MMPPSMTPSLLVLALWGCTPPVPDGDSGVPVDTNPCTLYADADEDGYGDPAVVTHTCDLSGFVDDASDCDDGDAEAFPGATEYCNQLDDDCDGAVDEGDPEDQVWHRDRDADGYGSDDDTLTGCEEPAGYTRAGGDCDDDDPDSFPGADEFCDGLDQDCDDTVDEEALDASTWYLDADGDDHGVADETTLSCDDPRGWAATTDDCDDSDDRRFPGNPELCDNVDNDCDATVDEAASDAPAWFLDSDGDGHGDPAEAEVACDAPPDHVDDATDCDDQDGTRYPDAPEQCDGDDEDCDSLVDEGVTETFYLDADADGYGVDTTTVEACTAPSDYVAEPGDCNDADGGIKPGASEGCDGVDEDCDTAIDEDPVDGDTFYGDSDGDGFGDALVSQIACELGSGWSATDDDCDDGDAAVNPDAAEVCDHTDQDCDSSVDEGATTTLYDDGDGDGHGDPAVSTQACSAPSGTVENSDDCDDGDATVNPDATEVCDTVDQDCDTAVDEGVTTTYYADLDADGYGDATSVVDACSLPASGYVADDTDCYDLNAAANTAQTAFFSTDRGDGSYDWTCDGLEEQELPDAATCAAGGTSGKTCEGDAGWESGVPACGDSATWVENCNGAVDLDGNCGGKTVTATQMCR